MFRCPKGFVQYPPKSRNCVKKPTTQKTKSKSPKKSAKTTLRRSPTSEKKSYLKMIPTSHHESPPPLSIKPSLNTKPRSPDGPPPSLSIKPSLNTIPTDSHPDFQDQLSPIPETEDLTSAYLTRTVSNTISNQREELTCAYHTYARMFLRALRNFIPLLQNLEGENCNEYYDIDNMPYLLTKNTHLHLTNKKGKSMAEKYTYGEFDNWEMFEKCSTGNQYNLVLYIFLYKISNDIWSDERWDRYFASLNGNIVGTFKVDQKLKDLSSLSMLELKDNIKEIMTGFFNETETKQQITRFNYICKMMTNVLNEFFENFYRTGNDFNMVILFYGIRSRHPKYSDFNTLYKTIKTIISKGYYLYISITLDLQAFEKHIAHAMVIYDIKKLHELKGVGLSSIKDLKDDDAILVLKNSWGDRSTGIVKKKFYTMKNGYFYLPLNKLKYRDNIFCVLPKNNTDEGLKWIIKHYSINNIPEYSGIIQKITREYKTDFFL